MVAILVLTIGCTSETSQQSDNSQYYNMEAGIDQETSIKAQNEQSTQSEVSSSDNMLYPNTY